MTTHYHAVVWIDHREAKVFHFNASDVDRLVLKAEHPERHIHRHRTVGSGHEAEDPHFLEETAKAIADAGAVLIVGPGQAKTSLMKHIEKHHPRQLASIKAVESADHPSDGQIVAHARKYFKAEDRITPQAG